MRRHTWFVGLLLMGASSAQSEPTTVAVDLSRLPESTYDALDGLDLEKRMVVRLVQDGFAVVAKTEGPDVLIVLFVDNGLMLQAIGPRGKANRRIALGIDASMSALHLELSQKAVDLARSIEQRFAARQEKESLALEQAAIRPMPSIGTRLLLDGGALFRGSFDIATGAEVTTPLYKSLLLVSRGAFYPHSNAQVNVYEWKLQIGLGWHQQLLSSSAIQIALLAGPFFHHFDVISGDSGMRVDFVVSAQLAWHVMLSERIGVLIGVSGGVATKSREHTRNNVLLWRREAARFATRAGFVVRF